MKNATAGTAYSANTTSSGEFDARHVGEEVEVVADRLVQGQQLVERQEGQPEAEQREEP